MQNALIVYYSWSQTTAKMAAMLSQGTVPVHELTVATDTFSADMYATADAAKQQVATGNLPQLTNSPIDLTQIDRLLVGGPVWGGTVSTPVRAFLQQLDGFHGTLAPFYTDAGSAGQYQADFEQLAGDHPVLPGIEMTQGDLSNAVTAAAALQRWAIKEV